MTPLLLVLAVAATYRTAYLVVHERGPWALAERLRSWVANRYGPGSWQHEGVNCVLCVSFWMGLLWAAVTLWGGRWGYALLVWQGVAGGAVIVHQYLAKR